MIIGSVFRQSKWSMKRKLFGYMLLLAALLIMALLAGFILFGRFESEEKDTFETLDIQMEVFQKDIYTHFDHIAAAGIQLSNDASNIIETYLQDLDLPFCELSDHDQAISGIQEALIEPLRSALSQEHCSGVFIILDATVNRSLPNADYSRTGLYLQQTGYNNSDDSILLYRGISDIGKSHGIMPHRKWRLEFQTDLIPNYTRIVETATTPVEKAYLFTESFTLPGTSDNAMLLIVPMFGSDGTFFGLCGFEISESYFVTYHAQPTKIEHLTCLLSPNAEQTINADASLSCGGSNGYYLPPNDRLTVKNAKNGLSVIEGEDSSYIGVMQQLQLSPNNPDFTLTVMMPKPDFDRAVRKSNVQNLVLWSLILFFAVSSCLYFSKRFLSPILKALDQIKAEGSTSVRTDVIEIDDLFDFLAAKDREQYVVLRSLEQDRLAANREKERLHREYESVRSQYATAHQSLASAQVEISRLAYSRTQEVDPDEYRQFLAGIDELTSRERIVFDYYLEGKSVKEILELANIKESTLRFHNRNIYSKLGVNSLKQLLRYAALMQQDKK